MADISKPMHPMKSQTIRTLLPLALCAPLWAQSTTLTIDAVKPLGKVSPTHHGLMTEEINYCYDGGLYAELIRNRAFLDDPKEPVRWSAIAGGKIALDATQALSKALPVSLKLDAAAAGDGVANSGYWGFPVKPSTTYRARFHAKAAPGFKGALKVAIQSEDGAVTFVEGKSGELAADWKSFDVSLTTSAEVKPTTKARFALIADQPGTVWLSLVSLFPPTWKDRPNGLRPDLMQMLVEMKPKFLRFPGGNYLEGDTIDLRFKWKETIGPLTERPGHQGPWGYRSTDGMGLMEFLLWAEDMGAEPVLGLYAGYSLKGAYVKPGKDLEPFVEEALEEIEYVMGPVTSKWGARRAKDGHPAPFKLRYVEIGNEDWFDKSGSYDGRYAQFHDAIKKRYPQLKCISSIGGEQDAKKRVHSRKPDVLDEHFYRTAETFLEMGRGYYDKADRKGPEIFVGEWAAHETPHPPWDPKAKQDPPMPNMKAALGDAAFMTNMERNSDIVTMQCYAPLFVNLNERQWRPDLIGYDALKAYGSPSFHTIRMFSTNLGDEILDAKAAEGSKIHVSATRETKTGKVFVKLVNATDQECPLEIDLKGVRTVAPSTKAEILSAPSTATNSMAEPTNVMPKEIVIEGVKPKFSYTLPASSIVVMKLDTK